MHEARNYEGASNEGGQVHWVVAGEPAGQEPDTGQV